MPEIISLPNKLPQAINKAEKGIKNIPTFIEVIALRFAIRRVMKLTKHTTTKGVHISNPPWLRRLTSHTDYVFRHSGIKLLLYHPKSGDNQYENQ